MTTDERIKKIETILTGLLKWLQTDEISSRGKDKYGELLTAMRLPYKGDFQSATPFREYCFSSQIRAEDEILRHKETWNAAIDAVQQIIKREGYNTWCRMFHDILDKLRAE